nr:reverse transcriptase domain-containing protein [Tanacetum cinerariifolium]
MMHSISPFHVYLTYYTYINLWIVTTPRAEVFTSFIIIFDSNNESTTLPMRPVPLLPTGIHYFHRSYHPRLEAMTTTNQGMSLAEVEQIIAQRVANAIETISVYETKTRMARESTNHTKQQEGKIVEDTNNKRKLEDDHKGSCSQQRNKEPKVFRAHTIGPSNKKGYAGKLPLCNKCMFHHIGPYAAKCGNSKR